MAGTGRAMDRKLTTSRIIQFSNRQRRTSPLPIGIGLMIAVFFSLALWAGIFFGMLALLDR